MAHFRKYYTTSAALTYYIPPRTTVTGIVAGLLGAKRDSYYETFSLENCKIVIGIKKPIKKIMQTMNLLHVEHQDELSGTKKDGSTIKNQTPTEFIVPRNPRDDYIDYQIWLHHKNPDIMSELEQLLSGQIVYQTKGISMALGVAYAQGWIKFAGSCYGQTIQNQQTKIASAVPISNIIEIAKIDIDSQYVKEEIPIEFDSQRHVTK